MQILLSNLVLTNFKGIRQLSIDFGSSQTLIAGKNGSGKTTLMDAFLWLFFDKDSSDRKDFEIKTIDENGKPFNKLDHEVSATVLINGEKNNFRKTYREKWTRKRGSENDEFTGHETSYFWNDVPLKKEEYQNKISSIINENLFKLLTNTTYFNSLKWQERRAVLIEIAGTTNSSDVLDKIANVSNKEQILYLTNLLNSGKSIEEAKKEISAKKKKLKDELILIPGRIDEAKRSIPEDVDYNAAESLFSSLNAQIKSIENIITNSGAEYKEHLDKKKLIIKERDEINIKVLSIESGIKAKLNAAGQELKTALLIEETRHKNIAQKITSLKSEATSIIESKNKMLSQVSLLRKEWEKTESQEFNFDQSEFSCPSCKRPYETTDINSKKEELTNSFNEHKSNKLSDLLNRANALNKNIADYQSMLQELELKGETLTNELSLSSTNIETLKQKELLAPKGFDNIQYEKLLSENTDYIRLIDAVNNLDKLIDEPFVSVDTTESKRKLSELNKERDETGKIIALKNVRDKQLERLCELYEQEKNMSQELATLEGSEYAINIFNKTKMDLLEFRINEKFDIVKFKMFEDQINGGQVETCTTLINGVPYADANTASKIHAGVDIIKTLSDHYGIVAPIWIDNRESVTEIPITKGQVISLCVSPEHKKIQVVK